MFDLVIFGTFGREFLLCPRRCVPLKIAAQTVFRVVYAMLHNADPGRMTDARFKIQAAYFHAADIFAVTEKTVARGRKHPLVVLRHHHRYVREMRGIMENDPFFAVMHIKVIRHNVFAENKTVFEPLHRHAAQRVVVVLIA